LIRATHWSPCPEPPELTEPVVPVEDTRLTKV
jgi:hypothetical protein